LYGTVQRTAPFLISIAVGILIWEVAGHYSNAAFLVPFSATLERLWELFHDGALLGQLLDSAILFVTGLTLAILVGMPAGMLLARMRGLRVAIEPYIMIIYATPMVALIPFILSMMGFGFAPKVLVVFLFAVFSVLYNTVEGARSMTGIRQAIGRALVGMVAAEFFLSSTGIGQVIMTASQNFDTAGVFASILLIGLIGVGLMRIGTKIENHFARWRN
jgi:ABC-type nitrate/sulfonate/bicarbonate transport system permease component